MKTKIIFYNIYSLLEATKRTNKKQKQKKWGGNSNESSSWTFSTHFLPFFLFTPCPFFFEAANPPLWQTRPSPPECLFSSYFQFSLCPFLSSFGHSKRPTLSRFYTPSQLTSFSYFSMDFIAKQGSLHLATSRGEYGQQVGWDRTWVMARCDCGVWQSGLRVQVVDGELGVWTGEK